MSLLLSGSAVHIGQKSGWLLAIGALLALGGCASSSPPQQPVRYEPTAVVSQISALEAELKQLRNVVEEQQFELENLKRRQQETETRMVQPSQIPMTGDPSQATGQASTAGMAAPITDNTGATAAPPPAWQTQVGGESTAPEVPVASEKTMVEPASPPPVAIESQPAPSAEQAAYDAAFDSLKQGRYEDAVGGFQGFVDTYPASQLAADAYYWMSEARYVNREFEAALNGFKTVVARYPDSQRVPEALLKVGYIQYDIGAYSDAAQTFRDIISQFPSHPASTSAESRLKRIESNTN